MAHCDSILCARNRLSALFDIPQSKGKFMQYAAPETTAEAARLLAESAGTAKVLAGGTDILVQMKFGAGAPDLLVDIKRIAGMYDITAENGGYRVGAAVSGAELGEHAGMVALWPGVVEAFELIGSTQVQGRCTLAGNLCNASPAADSVPAMVAAQAMARIVNPNGERDCAVQEIPVAPGKTSLAKGEFVASIFFPARPENASDAYLRFIPRTEMDIAVCAAGVSLTFDTDGICTDARVSLGAVAATVLLVEDAANALIGTKLDDGALEALGVACSAACNPIDDKRGTIEFRRDVTAVLAKRAAKIAQGRAGGKS
ncbi:MAG: CO/xanthine dehydrogenase FAD-binding subunit [Paracoccaceae bacterium]